MATKKYIVLNPYNLPAGVPMISWQDYTWYEGDDFDPPKGLNIDRLIAEQYIGDPAKTAPITVETEEEIDG